MFTAVFETKMSRKQIQNISRENTKWAARSSWMGVPDDDVDPYVDLPRPALPAPTLHPDRQPSLSAGATFF